MHFRTKQKSVEAGARGLFFTCDGHEKQALGEARNLLDELIEEKAGEWRTVDWRDENVRK